MRIYAYLCMCMYDLMLLHWHPRFHGSPHVVSALQVIQSSGSVARCYTFNDDLSTMYMGHFDGHVSIAHVVDNTVTVAAVHRVHEHRVCAIAYASSAHVIITCSSSRVVKAVNADNLEVLVWTYRCPDCATSAAVVRDRVLIGVYHQRVVVLDAALGVLVGTYDGANVAYSYIASQPEGL